MGGNVVAGGVLLDVYDLEVTGDPSPPAGAATEVTVSFKFTQPFYDTIWKKYNWPFTIKVYAEGYGDPWPPAGEPGGPYEWWWTRNGNCNQANPDYQIPVPVSLMSEGVYKLSAIVELDNNTGFVMGFSEEDVQISVWTAA